MSFCFCQNCGTKHEKTTSLNFCVSCGTPFNNNASPKQVVANKPKIEFEIIEDSTQEENPNIEFEAKVEGLKRNKITIGDLVEKELAAPNPKNIQKIERSKPKKLAKDKFLEEFKREAGGYGKSGPIEIE